MKAVNRIAKRIFTLFFRDRSAIFYTFLATGIMIAVYLFSWTKRSFLKSNSSWCQNLRLFRIVG